MASNRDEFSEETKRRLGDRVNLICSNPDCEAPTKGPHSDDGKTTNVGVAAHIYGAAKNGPRYKADQTPEQRRSIENGIWLCRICDKKVDGDEERYPPELLLAWKVIAERKADKQVGKPRVPIPVAPVAVVPPSDDIGNLRLLIMEVEHVRDRAKESRASWFKNAPGEDDYRRVKSLLSKVSMFSAIRTSELTSRASGMLYLS